MPAHDIAIIGGGIVGLASAWALTRMGRCNVIVLERENHLAMHQTGHNSGVIHSGLYYRPGSLKAQYCANGRNALYRFCAEHGVPHEVCGKIVVAVDESEQAALRELERRGQANGLAGVRRLSASEMKEREPHVQGREALWVPETGIVDFVAVAETYARLVCEAGGECRTGAAVRAIRKESDGSMLVTDTGVCRARYLINCAGLYSDQIARMAGLRPDVCIVPFRGEYVKLSEAAERYVRHLIYPVPDPRFPFLGVHFTRMIQGGVEAGPNALLTFRPNWYAPGDNAALDFRVLREPGFWKMVGKHGRIGLREMGRAGSRRAFLRALQRLIPEIRDADYVPHGLGIRAQAVGRDGTLLDDFRILEDDRQIHILNAPSPAATASLRIGRAIAEKANQQFS